MGRHKNKTKDCPIHGSKFMVTHNAGVRYCSAPTPGGFASKCFYHPTSKYAPYKERVDNDPVKPDVFRAMETEYAIRKHHKKLTKERNGRRKEDKDIPTEVQSPVEVHMAGRRNSKKKNGFDTKLPSLTYESIVADDDDVPEDRILLE
jgi:hypothetical protein